MNLNFLKSLDADDIFISYSRDDGSAYLRGLDAALSGRGFSCFTDRRGTDANRLPPQTLFRKIRTCKTLVLLGTPMALAEPENIAPEVTEFAEANGTARIVCISFDGGTEFVDWSNAPWFKYVEGKAREREDANTLKTGVPSQSIVDTVVAASDYMKSKDRLRKYRNRALGGFLMLLAAAIATFALAFYGMAQARSARDEAQTARRQADATIAQAKVDAANAVAQAQRDIKTAQDEAQKKISHANDLAKAADDKRAAAETQKKQAESLRDQAKAEAGKQSAIADSRSLANRSQALVRRGTDDLPLGLSVAMNAIKRSHTVEADEALRQGLGLLPWLRSSYKYAGHNDRYDAVAISPDGQYFATLKQDQMLAIYDSSKLQKDNQKPLKEIKCEDCSDIALSSGLAFAAGRAGEKGIRIIDLQNDARSHYVALNDLGTPSSFALSPGGRYLALSFNEGEDVGTESKVCVFDTTGPSGKQIAAFDDLNMKVNAIAFGPTGNLGVAGENKSPQGGKFTGRALVWLLSLKADDGKTEKDLSPNSFSDRVVVSHPFVLSAIAPGVDDSYFATDTGIWKKSSGRMDYEPIARFPYVRDFPSSSSIELMAFAPDGRSLTLIRSIGARDQNLNDNDEDDLEVWDTTEHESITQAWQSKAVTSLSFKPGEPAVATVFGMPTEQDPAVVYRVPDGQAGSPITLELEPGEKELDHFKSTHGYFVTTREETALVRSIWRNTKAIAVFGKQLTSVEEAAVSSNGNILALAGQDLNRDESIAVYQLDGDNYRYWKTIPQASVMSLSLSADGRRLAVLCFEDEGFVRVWDVEARRDISPKALIYNGEKVTASHPIMSDVDLLTLSPNGRYLAMTDSEKHTWLLDLTRGRGAPLMRLLDATTIKTMAFSSDNTYLGLGSDEGIVHVFETKPSGSALEICRLPHTGRVTAVEFSQDDQYIVTASSDVHPYHLNEEESYPVRVWLLQPETLLANATKRLGALGQN